MPQKEKRTTDRFLVQREDGPKDVVTEVTTFLIHEATGHRAAIQIEWFLDGESLIQDQSDDGIFRNTRGTFRRVR
jgi:hypothetical protein